MSFPNLTPPPPPAAGEPEREAWTLVLEAIEVAIDVEGLQSFDRGSLALFHERASRRIGAEILGVPAAWEPPTEHAIVSGPLGVRRLREFGVDSSAVGGLIYVARLLQIGDVEQATDEELLRIRGLGPRRLRQIRRGIERFNVALVAEATTAAPTGATHAP